LPGPHLTFSLTDMSLAADRLAGRAFAPAFQLPVAFQK